jgi:membrane associated rhomboid family serine protease
MAFYFFGSSVESVWGAFRYNVYLLIGYLLTAAAAFAAPDTPASASYVTTSVFLAFAALAPEATILLFVLPVKAKWLAALTWVGYALKFFDGGGATKLIVLAAVANFLLFFAGSLVGRVKQAKRRADFQRRAIPAPVRHECRVCGLTSDMAPRTAFRYCSQCAGQSCYCPDHLKNHEHVAAGG